MKIYKAEFELGRACFYIELFGKYDDCFNAAELLSTKLNATFTGILEEVKK